LGFGLKDPGSNPGKFLMYNYKTFVLLKLYFKRIFILKNLFYISVIMLSSFLYLKTYIITGFNKNIYLNLDELTLQKQTKVFYPSPILRRFLQKSRTLHIPTNLNSYRYYEFENSSDLNSLGKVIYFLCPKCMIRGNISEVLQCESCFKVPIYFVKIRKSFNLKKGIGLQALNYLNHNVKATQFVDAIHLLLFNLFFINNFISSLKKPEGSYILSCISSKQILLVQTILSSTLSSIIYLVMLKYMTLNYTNYYRKCYPDIPKIILEYKLLFFSRDKIIIFFMYNFLTFYLIMYLYLKYNMYFSIKAYIWIILLFISEKILDKIIFDNNPWFFVLYPKPKIYDFFKVYNMRKIPIYIEDITQLIFNFDLYLQESRCKLYYLNISKNLISLKYFALFISILLCTNIAYSNIYLQEYIYEV
jgi:hypothetical protein